MTTVEAMKNFEAFIDACGTRKKSIPHDEAMAQEFAAHPEQTVELMHELSRQANELEEENEHLTRQVKFLARELEKQGYAFTAEDWMAMAERETRGDTR